MAHHIEVHDDPLGCIARIRGDLGDLIDFATSIVGVPANGTIGYAPGCLLLNTVNGQTYINTGTLASCRFLVCEGYVSATQALPSNGTAGFAKGCILISNLNGATYKNTGTDTSCTFIAQDESTLGYAPIPLEMFRIIQSNDIPVLAGTPASGIMAQDTLPNFRRTNLATDKSVRIQWVATSVIEVQSSPTYTPPDMDVTVASTVNLVVKGAATDAFTFTINAFPGVGGADAGGATGAYTANSTVQTLSVTLAANTLGAFGGVGGFTSIALTPSAHGTDAINLYSAYLRYTKKLLTS